MGGRVETGCANCKRCTNSGVAEAGRKSAKLMANLATGGSVAMVQAFTKNCRACGHKMSLHEKGQPQQANVTVVVEQPAAVPAPTAGHLPAGYYPDPDGKPCQRWWNGYNWTETTAPLPTR